MTDTYAQMERLIPALALRVQIKQSTGLSAVAIMLPDDILPEYRTAFGMAVYRGPTIGLVFEAVKDV